MSIGLLFWILMVIWIVLGIVPEPTGVRYWNAGRTVILVVLLFLLGWHNFGFIIHD
jgi:hypothetical protein